MNKITLIRVYDLVLPAPENCFLIDRLWPRGISKERMAGVQWLKEVAPTNELRNWFHQNTEQWVEFEQRYREELNTSTSWQVLIEPLKKGKTVTLLFASKNVRQNQAIVLRDFLLERLTDSDKKRRQTGE